LSVCVILGCRVNFAKVLYVCVSARTRACVRDTRLQSALRAVVWELVFDFLLVDEKNDKLQDDGDYVDWQRHCV